MHECIVRLLKSSSDEESLECFARLITTTGKDLDMPEAKVSLFKLSIFILQNYSLCCDVVLVSLCVFHYVFL